MVTIEALMEYSENLSSNGLYFRKVFKLLICSNQKMKIFNIPISNDSSYIVSTTFEDAFT